MFFIKHKCEDKFSARTESIFNSDFVRLDLTTNEPVNYINRHCTYCKTHWYGKENEVKMMTSKEWNKWIEF